MSKKVDTTKVNRRFVPSLLAKKYRQDYEASVAEFPQDKKIEFVEHLLECLDIIETYIASPAKENWGIYAKKENAFLKKHGKRLKVYSQKNMYLYYGDPTVLAEKDIYTTEEWNSLSGEQQQLSPKEFASFVHYCRNILYHERDFLLLEQSPEDEREDDLNGASGNKEKNKKRKKIKRAANDNLTCLSQDQTVLLMYYLQQERVFLKDEFLKKTDAGTAFEILTGYSQETLRQDLGKPKDHQNKINLKEIDNLLTLIKIAIGKALKEK